MVSPILEGSTLGTVKSTGKGQEAKQTNITNRGWHRRGNWQVCFSIPEKLGDCLGMPSRKEMREESDLLQRRMELLQQNEVGVCVAPNST